MRVALASALVAATILAVPAALAAEIKVLSAAAVKAPLLETAAAFERETGHRVVAEFTTAGQVASRVAAGERVDVVANTRARLDEAAKAGRAGVVRDLGTVRIGVAVRPGANRPDVSTVEAFRAALVAASSVAYTNPAAGGTAGTYFAGVIDKLGLSEAMAGKRVLAADGLDVMKKVRAGEAELGITQASEIFAVDRSMYAGLLPESVQLRTTYAVFIPDDAATAARAFATALTNDAGRARFRAAGFD
jgi:molybdate transport system substrate-binding protein